MTSRSVATHPVVLRRPPLFSPAIGVVLVGAAGKHGHRYARHRGVVPGQDAPSEGTYCSA
ncbi:MAG TPA: hypothetical protein VFW09_13640 [Solirubrobacteraceae bacterium]|nr:hypothetical protein [Solirubrobacteraceae bacterium]